jgi:hypothetical protein
MDDQYVFDRMKRFAKDATREDCLALMDGPYDTNLREAFNNLMNDGCDVYEALLEVMEDGDWRYELPPALCPMCQLEAVTDGNVLAFLLKREGSSKDAIVQEIREQFPDYSALMEFLKEEG